MTLEFLTIAGEHRHEIDPIKGSRFLTSVAPAARVEEAEAFIERIRAEFAAASHNCWAYRCGREGEVFRSSDDGEPSGSAGRPILQQVEGHGLTNVAVVVTRWFGGTKLGVGGLMRAYGGAAGQTLDRTPQRTVIVKRRITVEHPYECSGAVPPSIARTTVLISFFSAFISSGEYQQLWISSSLRFFRLMVEHVVAFRLKVTDFLLCFGGSDARRSWMLALL